MANDQTPAMAESTSRAVTTSSGTTSDGQDCPSPPLERPIYLAIFEYASAIIPGLTRSNMRHTSLYVPNPPCPSPSFSIFHVIGTPGVGMTFQHLPSKPDPRDSEPTLLFFQQVACISGDRCNELEGLLAGVERKVAWGWNCQSWVIAALTALEAAGAIAEAERVEAVKALEDGIEVAYGGNTPNKRALED